MRNDKLKMAAGILLIFLGLCHQVVHVLFALNPEKPMVIGDMAAHKIQMMGTHSLMEFHSGFSLMTGFFLIGLGILIVLLRKKPRDLQVDVALLALMLTICVVSVVYFHVLAYGLAGLALIAYAWGSFRFQSL